MHEIVILLYSQSSDGDSPIMELIDKVRKMEAQITGSATLGHRRLVTTTQ